MPIAVDDAGTRVDELERADVDAVVVTPAHQHPTGVVLAGERRAALLAWLRERDAIAIEDDYDAEYRYDRAAVGALQGLDPDRVVYAGSASKTLAPALRLGWLVVPPPLLEARLPTRSCWPTGAPPASSSTPSPTSSPAANSTATCVACAPAIAPPRRAHRGAQPTHFPRPTIRGMAAGLHVTVYLPDSDDEQAIREEASARRIEIETMSDFRPDARERPPALMLGYAQMPEPAIRAGIRELSEAVRAARRRKAGSASR